MPSAYNPQKDVFNIIDGKKQPVNPYDTSGKKKQEPHLESLRFDGERLTAFAVNKEGRRFSFSLPADSGFPLDENHSVFDYSPQRQQQKDEGPIPEGTYTVNPKEIQHPNLIDEAIGMAGALAKKKLGRFPGGSIPWGNCRIPITQTEEQAQKTKRDGFSIHGGKRRGSAGCIDLTDKDEKFCEFIEKYRGKNQTSVPLTVEYPKNRKK